MEICIYLKSQMWCSIRWCCMLQPNQSTARSIRHMLHFGAIPGVDQRQLVAFSIKPYEDVALESEKPRI